MEVFRFALSVEGMALPTGAWLPIRNILWTVYSCSGICGAVKLIEIYQCFCDETRLRIVNLLTRGPLCVCHLQEVLDETQVRVSKHLAYMKEKGLVEALRHQSWMIYSLPQKRSAELEANLKCLQDCVQTHTIFKADLRRLERLRPKTGWLAEISVCAARQEPCCTPAKGTGSPRKDCNR